MLSPSVNDNKKKDLRLVKSIQTLINTKNALNQAQLMNVKNCL
jgi:hypothetical protein